MTPSSSQTPDVDWVVIGSGFGGSVSALRLAQKGYSVRVLEAGRRFADSDFAKTTWQARRYYWMPRLGLTGILRMTVFRDVFVVSGSGVGGGSLGYANTLYRAPTAFFEDPQWRDLADWEAELQPCYDEAERMLGVTTYDAKGAADEILEEYAHEIGVGETFRPTRVGVFLGAEGETVPDPYFGGEGPDRTGCLRCGSCMVGCRHGAKNTLMKNYLWFAERLPVDIRPLRTVTDIQPHGAEDGSQGYIIRHRPSGAWLGRGEQTVRARGVVIAAGTLGTNRLLFRCKLSGSLPRLSDRLGYLVRTNSESILAVTAPPTDRRDFTRGVAITSSIYPTPDTHIEPVTYGAGADSQSLLFALLTESGRRGTRPLHFLRAIARHPRRAARAARIKDWSRQTMIILVMQTLDGAMRLKVRRRLPGGDVVLTTEQDALSPNPDQIPAAYDAAAWLTEKLRGTPQAVFTEATMSIPTTAHILGGAVIGSTPENGVIDAEQRVFGYENLLVCDGAAIPANVGVNPSLTITALAERAIAKIPPGSKLRSLGGRVAPHP